MKPEEGYVTVKEAAQRRVAETRQVDRFIKRGKLEVIHYSASLRKLSVTSIEAFMAERGHRPIDPLAHIKELLHGQEQVIGDSLRQLALLRQQESEHYTAIQRRCADLEGQVRQLRGELQQEQEARRRVEQLVATIATGRSAEDLAPFLGGSTLRALSRRHLSPLAKRGYPLVTIYERLEAEVNKREWWLLPEQQPLLIAYRQAQGRPYTACIGCPHGEGTAGKQEQAPVEQMKST